jgi:hypothetical protein
LRFVALREGQHKEGIMDRLSQRRLVVVMVLSACCAGCGSPPLFQVETQIQPDGSCQRTIWQPKGEMVPKEALEPAWNARWTSVGPVGVPPAFAKQHPSHGDHQYFMAKGTFSSPREIPRHFRYTLEKSPEIGASELTRSYDRADYGLVVEHCWREKLTNIVTLSGFFKARDEFLDLALPLAEQAIEQIYGGKYDVKNLVLEVRSRGRRFVEQAALVFYDNLSRNLPEAEQYSRLAAVAKPYGLDLFDAKGNLVDGEQGNKRFRDFLLRLVSRGMRRPDGVALTDAELQSVIEDKPPYSTARESFAKEHKTEFETQLLPRFVRMTGLYHLPLAFMFRGGPRFAFSLHLPGELTEPNGTIDGRGATSWRFGDERLFPEGFEMKARSLDWRTEDQQKILGRVVLADRASAETFIEIVKDCPPLLDAVRAAVKTGEATPLRGFQPKTEGERVQTTKLREQLGL